MRVLRWYRQDQAQVAAGVRAGRRPEMATTTAAGPLDELVALHDQVGSFAAVAGLALSRKRAGIDDGLLLRTLAVLPFVGQAGFRGLADQRFRAPAVLLPLGWSPVQIRAGANGRSRHADGRQAESLPGHPDTLRDALARIAADAWLAAQQRAVEGRSRQGLVRGGVDAVDGTGLSATQRVAALVCVSATHPVVVAWRDLEGAASEQGQEAGVTRALRPAGPRQVLAAGGAGCIRRLRADGLDADGPLLAWRQYQHGSDALVRLPADRLLDEDRQGLVRGRRRLWQEHRSLRTVRGHQERRTVALAGTGHVDRWPSCVEAAATDGAPEARRWACLLGERAPAAPPLEDAGAVVSTRAWARPSAAFQADRARWRIEDDPCRERKEGWGLERQQWGIQPATIRGRVALTRLACNTAQRYRTHAGRRLADKGIRRLRQRPRREFGAAPVVLDLDRRYGVFAVEEILAVLGAPVRERLRPAPRQPRAAPTGEP